MTVCLPPLRQRLDDLPLLVGQFLSRFNRELNTAVARVDAAVWPLFECYPWPGNVRELESALCHGLILARTGPPDGWPPEVFHPWNTPVPPMEPWPLQYDSLGKPHPDVGGAEEDCSIGGTGVFH
jgi:DNA-binding NtrC family response regulator